MPSYLLKVVFSSLISNLQLSYAEYIHFNYFKFQFLNTHLVLHHIFHFSIKFFHLSFILYIFSLKYFEHFFFGTVVLKFLTADFNICRISGGYFYWLLFLIVMVCFCFVCLFFLRGREGRVTLYRGILNIVVFMSD